MSIVNIWIIIFFVGVWIMCYISGQFVKTEAEEMPCQPEKKSIPVPPTPQKSSLVYGWLYTSTVYYTLLRVICLQILLRNVKTWILHRELPFFKNEC